MSTPIKAPATPAEHRSVVASILGRAPSHDHKILPRPARHTDRPRHSQLAEQLRSLLEWRRLTELADAEEVGTNWMAALAVEEAANDNMAPDDEVEIRPSVDELLAAVRDVVFTERRIGSAPGLRPVGGDIERDDRGRLLRVGGLLMAEPDEVEPPLVRSKIYRYRVPMRQCEAWFRPVERRQARPTPAGHPPDPIPNPSDCEASDNRRAARQQMARLRSSLGPAIVRVLDAGISAQNFAEIGVGRGFAGKRAEREGKVALLAACAALDQALATYAALEGALAA